MTTFLVDESTFLGRDEHIGYILSEGDSPCHLLSGHGRYWQNNSSPNCLQPSHCVGIF